jgi:hypothetical protein
MVQIDHWRASGCQVAQVYGVVFGIDGAQFVGKEQLRASQADGQHYRTL